MSTYCDDKRQIRQIKAKIYEQKQFYIQIEKIIDSLKDEIYKHIGRCNWKNEHVCTLIQTLASKQILDYESNPKIDNDVLQRLSSYVIKESKASNPMDTTYTKIKIKGDKVVEDAINELDLNERSISCLSFHSIESEDLPKKSHKNEEGITFGIPLSKFEIKDKINNINKEISNIPNASNIPFEI